MKRVFKSILLLVMLIAAVSVATGCEYEEKITVDSRGEISVSFIEWGTSEDVRNILVSIGGADPAEVAAMSDDDIAAAFAGEEGFLGKQVREDGKTYFGIDDSASDLERIQGGVVYDITASHFVYDCRSINDSVRSSQYDEVSAVVGEMSYKLYVTMPDEIVNTNGELSADKKTVFFDLGLSAEDVANTYCYAYTAKEGTSDQDSGSSDSGAPVETGSGSGMTGGSTGSDQSVPNEGTGTGTGEDQGTPAEDNSDRDTPDAGDKDVEKSEAGEEETAPEEPKKLVTLKGKINGKYTKAKKLTVACDSKIKWIKVNGVKQKSKTIDTSKDGKYVIKVSVGDVTETFTVIKDTTKPKVSGVKNNKTYKKTVTIKFSDATSGIKSAKLNGKKIKNGKKVKAAGDYTLKITDKAGNVRAVRFTIDK